MRRLLILIFLTGIISTITAKNRLISIGTVDGLPQSDVHCVIQDYKGFMWMATNDGLCRYDGYEFKIFRIGNNGLTSNLILALAQDRFDNIWIGTADKGLIKYDVRDDRFKKIEKYGNNVVRDILIDRHDNIWIKDDQAQIVKLEANNDQSYKITTFRYAVQDMTLSDSGELFIVSDGAVYKFAGGDSFSRYNIPSPVSNWKIFVHNDIIYTILNKKIWSYNLSDKSFRKVSDIDAINFFITTSEMLLIANSEAIYAIPLTNQSQIQTLYKGDIWITGFTEDCFGTVWFGSYRNGVFKLEDQVKPFRYHPTTNNVEVLYEDIRSRLWFGTISGQVNCMPNDRGGTNIPDKHVTITSIHKMVTAITEHPLSDKLYVGNMGGIIAADRKRKDCIFENVWNLTYNQIGDIRCLMPDSNYLWIASYTNGLVLYDVTSGLLVNQFSCINAKDNLLPSNIVRSLLLDSKHNLWIGTGNGLCVIKSSERFLKKPHITVFKSGDGANTISHNYILPIYESADGNIWVGTLGGGLNCLSNIDKEFNFTNTLYSTANGLSNNTIKAIIEDQKGCLWVSTNRGLNRISANRRVISQYDIHDGLQDYEFCELSCVKRRDGELVFGGVKGFNSFYPDQIVDDTIKPKISITDFQLWNNSVMVGDNIGGNVILSQSILYTKAIRLSHDQDSFSFIFSSIHPSSQGKQKYRYKLEGFDNDFIITSGNNRIAKYTNISPGHYRFIIQSCNNSELWSDTQEIDIRIVGPIWMRWYAIIIYFIMLTMGIYLLLKIRERRQKHRYQVFIANQEKVQIKKLSQAKIDFFTNLSHEFRTPLTLIMSPLQKILSTENLDTHVVRLLKIIEHNSDSLLRLIDQIMDFSKHDKGELNSILQSGDIVTFARKTFEQFTYLADQRRIETHFYSSCDRLLMLFDEHQMEEIIYNLVSNAIKHTPDEGSVIMEIDKEGNSIVMRMSDSGVGIESAISSHIFERFYSTGANNYENKSGTGIGLSLTKALVEQHNGSIDFFSEHGMGTTFVVTLPYDPDIHQELLCDVDQKIINDETHNDVESSESLQRTILVVDDNPDIVTVLEELLSPQYRVLTALNGQQAYEKCINMMPTMIITDVMMPGIDGVELCRMVKSNNLTSHIPVIMLTAKVSKEAQTEGLNANADAYCTKPFDNNLLLSTIRSVIANRERIIDKFRSTIDIRTEEITTNQVDKIFMDQLIKIIEDNMTNIRFNVEFVCKELGISQINLNKKLKVLTNQTANMFIKGVKLRRAAQMLCSKKYSVADVTYAVGFNDLKHFRESFKEEFGVLPSDFNKENIS